LRKSELNMCWVFTRLSQNKTWAALQFKYSFFALFLTPLISELKFRLQRIGAFKLNNIKRVFTVPQILA